MKKLSTLKNVFLLIVFYSGFAFAAIDFENGKCIESPSFQCPNGGNVIYAVENNCGEESSLCPSGYRYDPNGGMGHGVCYKAPEHCDNFDRDKQVCWTDPSGVCNSVGGTFERKGGIFNTTNLVCKINPCPAGQNMVNGKCVGQSTAQECPILLDGWVPVNLECKADEVKKWESSEKPHGAGRPGPQCVKRFLLGSANSPNPPLQDYELDAAIANQLPHYFLWKLHNGMCEKKVRVFRCYQDKRHPNEIEFKETTWGGMFYGKVNKNPGSPKNGYACYAEIPFKKNYWVEKFTTKEAAAAGAVDKIKCEYVTLPTYRKVTRRVGFFGEVYLYTEYTPGRFKCYIPYYEYSSGLGSWNNEFKGAGYRLTLRDDNDYVCYGSYGPSGQVHEDSDKIGEKVKGKSAYTWQDEWTYSNCDAGDIIKVKDNFYWEEKCPDGYSFNNSARVTAPENRKWDNRYRFTREMPSNAINDKRCFLDAEVDAGAGLVKDFEHGLYLQKHFAVVEEPYKVPARTVCTEDGYVLEGGQCVKEAPSCPEGTKKWTDGFCYAPINSSAQITCPTGYEYNANTGRCENSIVCEDGDTPNREKGRCERPIIDPGCFVSHIEGYDFLCEVENTCPPGTEFVSITDSEGRQRGYCTSEAVKQCPEGYKPDPEKEGYCVSEAFCPDGWVEDPENPGLCKMTYHWSKFHCDGELDGDEMECPEGYIKEGDGCVADPICPEGSVYNPSTGRCFGIKHQTITLVLNNRRSWINGECGKRAFGGYEIDIPDASKVESVVLKRIEYDDYYGFSINGKFVVAAFNPWGTLYTGSDVTFEKGSGSGSRVPVRVGSYSGACERSHHVGPYNFNREVDKSNFKNGVNKIETWSLGYHGVISYAEVVIKYRGGGAKCLRQTGYKSSTCNVTDDDVIDTPPICPGNGDLHDGKCYTGIGTYGDNLYTCPSGYRANASKTYCYMDSGFCPSGFEYDARSEKCFTRAADFTSWIVYGSNSNWQKHRTYVYQTVNGEPTYLISNYNLGKSAKITGKFKVKDRGDDDFAGIVFGWSDIKHHYVFDWKKNNQGSGKRGIRIVRVNNNTSGNTNMWSYNSDNTKTVLVSNYGYSGWVPYREYTLSIEYKPGRIEAFIDGQRVLTYDNPNFSINQGKVGFYNYSQSNVEYKDFYIETDPVCPPPGQFKNGKCIAGITLYGRLGPIDPGNDCQGECNSDGCWCTMKNPPANNCREIQAEPDGYYKVKLQRPLLYHFISGEPLVPEDFGKVKNIKCEDGCIYFVDRITTNGNEMCFHKTSGEESCFKVDRCYFVGSITVPEGEHITGLELVDNHTIVPLNVEYKPGNEIISSCRVNGHMGYVGYKGGIASVNMGLPRKRYFELSIDGLFDISKEQNKEIRWQGFNIGTVALKYSDGNWYVARHMLDDSGNEVDRDLPNFIKFIDNENFKPFATEEELVNSTIQEVNSGLECKYAGKKLTEGTCLKHVRVFAPLPDMDVIAIRDIESLKNHSSDFYQDLKIDITYKAGKDSNRTFSHASSASPDIPVDQAKSNFDTTEASWVIDRLEFWNSFADGFVGFLEFIRETRDQDRLDGFIPENTLPYILNANGYTSIYYDMERQATIIVSPHRNKPLCSEDYKIDVNALQDEDLKKKIYQLGGYDPNGCVMLVPGVAMDFHSQYYSQKIKYYTGGYEYKCSPFDCVGHQCYIAKCVPDSNGIGTSGVEVPSFMKKDGFCTKDKCDGTKDYVKYCGYRQDCRKLGGDYMYDDTGRCYEYYCDEGILNEETKRCKVERCPEGSIEQPDGTCVIR